MLCDEAALDTFTVQLAATPASRAIAVVSLHPGWVRTRMGGGGAAIDVATSADGMMRVIDGLAMQSSGSFVACDGNALAW